MNRPFYTTFGWAYDRLIQGPVTTRIDFVEEQLRRRGILAGAHLLDAGCGTGAYSVALAERGFSVTGIDTSAELLAEAKGKAQQAGVHIYFQVGDILTLPEDLATDAVLCRGVLNDLIKEEDRRAVFGSFAGVLRLGGVVILDVREWHLTAARKTQNPVFEKTVETERGRLTFRSVIELQPQTQSLLVSEMLVLESSEGRQVTPFDFVMKCWTKEELAGHLIRAGFDSLEYFGDYDSVSTLCTTDRLIAVATLRNK
jgi:SAM-dependent methyltransferase